MDNEIITAEEAPSENKSGITTIDALLAEKRRIFMLDKTKPPVLTSVALIVSGITAGLFEYDTAVGVISIAVVYILLCRDIFKFIKKYENRKIEFENAEKEYLSALSEEEQRNYRINRKKLLRTKVQWGWFGDEEQAKKTYRSFRHIAAALIIIYLVISAVMSALYLPSWFDYRESRNDAVTRAEEICTTNKITDAVISLDEEPFYESGNFEAFYLRVESDELAAMEYEKIYEICEEIECIELEKYMNTSHYVSLIASGDGKEFFLLEGALYCNDEKVTTSEAEKKEFEEQLRRMETDKFSVKVDEYYLNDGGWRIVHKSNGGDYSPSDYSDAEDMYEEHYDDFDSYEDAEDYYNE